MPTAPPARPMLNTAMPGGPAPGTPPSMPAPAPAPAAPAPYAPPQVADTDTHPDAMQPSNDPYINEVRASGKSKSEDYQRMSDAEIMAWKPFYIGNGKFKNKYGDIVDKPWERGPNTPAGVNGVGTPGDYGGGGGAGGGGGIPGLGQGRVESSTIWQAILDRLNGGTRYTPEAMSGFLSEVKNTAEAQSANQAEEATAAAAATGMGRAPGLQRQLAGIRANTYGQVLSAKNQLMKAKIDADYQDKTSAIQQGLDWLNSLRTYTANMAATQAQKAAAMANIDLGYARLNQEQNSMREQYAQQLAMMGLG